MYVIDTRNTDGQLVVVGGALVLPTSDYSVSPRNGSLRWNVSAQAIEYYSEGWISLNLGEVVFQGTWNAATNIPHLTSGVGTKGYYYKVSVSGNTMIDGNNIWLAGDSIIFDGIKWTRIASADQIALADLNDVHLSGTTAGQVLAYDGTGWSNTSEPYDVYGTFLGIPSPSQILWRIVFARDISFPSGMGSSKAFCQGIPSAAVSLPFLKNSVKIGSINYTAGQTAGSFVMASPTVFHPGDLLEVDAPTTTDLTFHSPSWVFVGTR